MIFCFFFLQKFPVISSPLMMEAQGGSDSNFCFHPPLYPLPSREGKLVKYSSALVAEFLIGIIAKNDVEIICHRSFEINTLSSKT